MNAAAQFTRPLCSIPVRIFVSVWTVISMFVYISSPLLADNLALNKPILDSSGSYAGYPGFEPTNITDGVEGDIFSDGNPDSASYWLGHEGNPNEYITVDLGASTNVQLIGLKNTHNSNNNDRATKFFQIRGSNNAADVTGIAPTAPVILRGALSATTGPANDLLLPNQQFTGINGLVAGSYQYLRLETDSAGFFNANVGLNELYVSNERNVALGKPVIKSDNYGAAGFEGQNATDGVVGEVFSDFVNFGSSSYWLGGEGLNNQSFTVDLGRNYFIDTMKFRNTHNGGCCNDRGTDHFSVQTSTSVDGLNALINPTTFISGQLTDATGTGQNLPTDTFTSGAGVVARYLQFNAIDRLPGKSSVGLNELMAFEAPNFAAGKPVIKSDNYGAPGFEGQNATDGVVGEVFSDFVNPNSSSYWLGGEAADNQSFTVDLLGPHSLLGVGLINTHNGGCCDDRGTANFKIEASLTVDGANDLQSPVTLLTGTLASVAGQRDGMAPEVYGLPAGSYYRYLRFTALTHYGSGAGLNEFQVFVPEPASLVMLTIASLALLTVRRREVTR